MKKPNFIYVGTGKAGTTWLFEILKRHPDVFVTPVKETNFFDLNFHRGLEWYENFFKSHTNEKAIGEISHRYIHSPYSAERIKDSLGPVKIIIGLRHPVDYCISDFQFTSRNGRYDKDLHSWVTNDFNWDDTRYRNLVQPFVDTFGKSNIFIYNFKDIKSQPQDLIDRLTEFLEVQPLKLSEQMKAPINPTTKARSKIIASIVNRTAKYLKRRGGQKIIAAVKYNKVVQSVLYSKVTEKPKPTEGLMTPHLETINQDVQWLHKNFDIDIMAR